MERDNIEKVSLSDCPDCLYYDECLNDGYLDGIKEKYGIKSKDDTREKSRELALVRKWTNRANDHSKNPKYKNWCDRKITGDVDIDDVGPVPTIEDISAFLSEHKYPFSPEPVWEVTRSYLIQKGIWKGGHKIEQEKV